MCKSTGEDDRQALSIEAQVDEIKKQFSKLKITFIKDNSSRVGESMSAAKPSRPLFNNMMDDPDSGKYQGVMAWHPDRLSRNAPDAARFVWDIQQNHIKDVKFCNFMFEKTPEGIMMLQMIMSQAQYFSAKLKKDIRRGNAQKRKNGGLIIRHTLYNSLNNIRYAGITVDPHTGDQFKTNYPAMITIDEYYKIQELLGRKGSAKLLKHDRYFALRGFIRCGQCDCLITAEGKKKHQKSGNAHTYRYYRCSHNKKGVSCHQIAIREEKLYEQLRALLDKYELIPELHETVCALCVK